MSRAGNVGADRRIQIFAGLCSLTGRVWIAERRVKAFHGPSVNGESTDAPEFLKESTAPAGEEKWGVGWIAFFDV